MISKGLKIKSFQIRCPTLARRKRDEQKAVESRGMKEEQDILEENELWARLVGEAVHVIDIFCFLFDFFLKKVVGIIQYSFYWRNLIPLLVIRLKE